MIDLLKELLVCAAVPAAQVIGLGVLGYLLRVDRKPKGSA